MPHRDQAFPEVSTTQVKPQGLPSPVPGAEVPEDEFAALGVGRSVGQAAQVAAATTEEDEFAEFGIAPVAPVTGPTAEEPGLLEAVVTDPQQALDIVKDGVRESFARFKVSFGVTETEQLAAAQQVFPGAKIQAGTLMRPNRQGVLVPLDPDSIELIDDVLDFSRDIAEGVIENVLRFTGTAAGTGLGLGGGAVVGAGAGTVSPVPGGAVVGATAGAVTGAGLGALAGTAVGGALGAATAKEAGDFIQEKLIGIPIDPKRDLKTETAIAAAFGGTFNFLGSKLARRRAAKAAKKAAERKVDIEAASEGAQDAIEAVETVRQAGLAKSVDGTDILLAPNQLNPNNPETRVAAEALSTEGGFRNFMREQAKVLSDAYDKLAAGFGNIGTEKFGLSNKLATTVRDIDKAEGAMIGSFRDEALKASRGTPQSVGRFSQAVGQMFDNIKPGAINLTPNDVDSVLDAFPDLTASQAKVLLNKMNKFSSLMQKTQGQLPLSKINTEYTQLTTQINLLSKGAAGKPLAFKLIQLKDALRDDWTDAIGNELGPQSLTSYRKALSRFGEIKTATKTLNNVLKGEGNSKEALARDLFTSKAGLERIKATKVLVQEKDPELWNDLIGEYLEGLKRDAFNKETGRINWEQISRKIEKLGPEARKEIFDSPQFGEKQVDALLKLGRLTQAADFAAKPKPATINRLRQLFKVLAPTFITTKAAAAEKLIQGMGKNNALARFLSQGGIDDVLKGLPVKKRNIIKGKLLTASANLIKRTAVSVTPRLEAIRAVARPTGEQEQ